MPGLVRRLLLFAAVDGLVLQPAPPRNHPPTTQQAIKIDYQTNGFSPLFKDRRDEETAPASLETYGLLGMLKVASSSFLISISRREQVAQIRGKPVYVVTDVALIPLSSQAEADKAIVLAREAQKRHGEPEKDEESSGSDTDTIDESSTDSLESDDGHECATSPGAAADEGGSAPARRTSIAEDVIGRKGLYGRFAAKWFSRTGWSAEGRKMQGMSSQERSAIDGAVEANVEDHSEVDIAADDKTKTGDDVPPEQVTISLLPRILRTTKIYFGSRSLYFSYDYDLSRNISKQAQLSNLPLFKQFDELYFWNKHIMEPFIKAGQHSFVLPVIQGFVGQRAFYLDAEAKDEEQQWAEGLQTNEGSITLEELGSKLGDPIKPEDLGPSKRCFTLTLISRRSTARAGLRYLRRGVDETGASANTVETEQILSNCDWEASTASPIFSFVQVRGSIPLFFSQSPYSLKPLPIFWGSPETNAAAFRRHFANLATRYGSIVAVSLVDRRGTEAKIGEAYEQAANSLNESEDGIDGKGSQLAFKWFDFHNECRGMRFENVSRLIDALDPILEQHQWITMELDSGHPSKVQTGVVRTNCMDCLDRTNVVQSALGRWALTSQLATQNLTINLHSDPLTAWFNTLWADNGDAISRQYAGTAALKGDYTRTRRRHLVGALADFGLTLSRYYTNIVNDYFAQAVIDYLLGRASVDVFADFEADLIAADCAVDLRRVRQAAISTCAQMTIEGPDEDLVAGWTLSCPAETGATKSARYEESVLLLTDRAVYLCRFDWGTEKVREFERVGLGTVTSLRRGVYITNTLAPKHMNEKRNVGFMILYKAPEKGEGLVRVNTRSLASEKETGEEPTSPGIPKTPEDAAQRHELSLSFKALPPSSSYMSMEGQEGEPLSEREMIDAITDEIVRVARNYQESSDKPKVEEKDIISLEEAKRSTGLLEQIGYSLKKLVWA
ncbi:SacI domain protein [Lineolata rhizophorae]|uniref:SacI domain protein n=1 Tax=Lineolata rhizophorae TaxID=578093 RepID=A0A6A6PDD8_9PEZI|nr:SacI domain protein [Lineolata rhizophorae]